MFELVVIDVAGKQASRHELPAGRSMLGREQPADVVVSCEPFLSRCHVALTLRSQSVLVTKLNEARNAVYFHGVIATEFEVHDGEHFVIGETQFRIERHATTDESPHSRAFEEMTFDARQLRNIPFSDAEKRIEVLTHLPRVILGARTHEDFLLRVVQLLLAGVPRAEAVAITELTPASCEVLCGDRRTETAGSVRPSARLVREALMTSRRSVLHVWEPTDAPDSRYTAISEFNWAFCTPVFVPGEPPRGLYVAGRHGAETGVISASGCGTQLQADVRFTELVAEIISSLRRLRALERHQAGLRQFFAPPILEALGEDLNPDLLEPRECDVTVLFCDLRGFSQKAELEATNLKGLLSRVSQALSVMTEQILKFGGVTGDFQGDAALGFWGWPLASAEAPLNACRAALSIRAAFEQAASTPGHPLQDFRMGIGIAHGRAVAGKIGTQEQVKVTVFGPVVNLASRLETMTSQLRVPIVIDEPTANFVRSQMDRSVGRVRKLAKVLPVGMETPVLVSELLPPASEYPLLSDDHIAQFEKGVDDFIAGRWETAWQCLHSMPAGDRAQDFLSIPIVQNNRTAPPEWDGVVRLARK